MFSKGHPGIAPGDDIDFTAVPLWVRGLMNPVAGFNATTGFTLLLAAFTMMMIRMGLEGWKNLISK
jgi:hypothetical protein